MFSFKLISLLFTQFRVAPLTNKLNQQQFSSIVIILCTSFAYKTNVHQIFIAEIFEPSLSSSHNTDRIPTESLLSTLSCLF